MANLLNIPGNVKRVALASVAAAPLCIAFATPAQAQIVNTATVTGTPDSGTLAGPIEATESVTVALPIVAANDSVTGVNGASGNANVLNVLTGDTLNSLGVTTSEVTITLATGSTVPSELTFDPATGVVGVVAGTAAGPYTFDYTICETANPNNCATATVTVTVDPSVIVATDDSVTGINGASGATDVLNVFGDDTVNGVAAATTNSSLSVPANDAAGNPNSVPSELVFDPTDGSIDVVAGTPAGTYSFTYEICEDLNPTNCETAVASVTVDPSVIVATDDSATGINGASGATDVLNVFGDDTVNGVAAATTNSSLSVPANDAAGNPNSVPSELVFDPTDGSVDVVAGTPAGTYSFTYEICEDLNPTNCETAVASLTVEAAPIVAVDDTATGVDGLAGDTNALNVLDDDTLNSAAATLGNVDITVATGSTVPPELTFDPATGVVGVLSNTLADTYSFQYTICEELNPTNCDTATATVEVASDPRLEMTKEADDDTLVVVGQVITYTYTVTNTGNVVIRNVAITDTHNAAGAAPTPAGETLFTDAGTTGDSIDNTPDDGNWDVLAPGDVIRFTGTYTVQQADIDNLQ